MKFYDVKSKIFTKKAPKESELLDDDDDEDDTWLDEPADIYPSENFLKAEASSPIDLAASMHLRTFLADDKPASVSDHHTDGVSLPTSPLDDNDFSMDFE